MSWLQSINLLLACHNLLQMAKDVPAFWAVLRLFFGRSADTKD
jgi:hypothetical protein